jgi:hypothetical protein
LVFVYNWYDQIIFTNFFEDFSIAEITVDSVKIRVENKGGYLARVLIHYHDSAGQEQTYSSGNFPALQTSLITLDDSAESIEIEVQMYAFIMTPRTVFKTNNPCPHTRCFVIGGTIFKADWNEVCCQL